MNNEEGTEMKNGESGTQKIISDATRIRFAERTAKKAGVAKGAWTTAVISFILLVAVVAVGISLYKSEQKNQLAVIESQKQSFTEMLTKRDSMINESMLTFDEIEKNLNTIKEKEKIITIMSKDSEFSKNKKQQMSHGIHIK